MMLVLCILVCTAAITASADGMTDEERAESFINAVNNISQKTSLAEREMAIALARSEEVYFDDESFEGVSEALAKLAEEERLLEEQIAYCLEFCDLVDAASALDDIEDYLELKALIEQAREYLDIIDTTYIGVPGAMNIFGNVKVAVLKKEQKVQTYLGFVTAMSEAKEYSEKHSAYKEAQMIASARDFLYTHPDVYAAEAAFREADAYFSDCALVAAMFAEAVDNIGSADVTYEAINDAFVIYVGMDKTYPSSYIGEFETIVEEYNSTAEKINSIFG